MAKSVAEAWQNHVDAFSAKDLEKIMLSFSATSIMAVFNTATGKTDEYKGVEGAKVMFTGLFKMLDLATWSGLVMDVEEDIGTGVGQVFLVWQCPGSGVKKATDTVLYDKNFKIARQNIVMFPMAKLTLYYWDFMGRASAAINMLEESKVEYEHVKDRAEIAKFGSAFGAESSSFAPPIITDGEKTVSQSIAVAIFAGEKAGFDKGVDMVVATQYMLDLVDMAGEISKAKAGGAEAMGAFCLGADGAPSRLSKWLGNIERSIKGPFYFGDSISYVDYFLHQGVQSANFTCWDAVSSKYDWLAQSPKIKAVADFIQNQDSFKNTAARLASLAPGYKVAPESMEGFLKLLDPKV